MKVEFTIDSTKELTKCAVLVLGKEMFKRLQSQFEECSLFIRWAGLDVLSVYGVEREAKKKIEEILQQTRESADDWFY